MGRSVGSLFNSVHNPIWRKKEGKVGQFGGLLKTKCDEGKVEEIGVLVCGLFVWGGKARHFRRLITPQTPQR